MEPSINQLVKPVSDKILRFIKVVFYFKVVLIAVVLLISILALIIGPEVSLALIGLALPLIIVYLLTIPSFFLSIYCLVKKNRPYYVWAEFIISILVISNYFL